MKLFLTLTGYSFMLLAVFIWPQERGKVVEYSRGVVSRPFQNQADYVLLTKEQTQAAQVDIAKCEAAQAKLNEAEARLALLIHAIADEQKVPDGFVFNREIVRFEKVKEKP